MNEVGTTDSSQRGETESICHVSFENNLMDIT